MDTIYTPLSSNIAAYRLDGSTLYIHFNNGTTYSYSEVPETVCTGFREAESVGRFFNQNVKARFDYQKLTKSESEALGFVTVLGDNPIKDTVVL